MCGILGSGKCDAPDMDILERDLRWTEEGLEYEASDKHRHTLLDGLGWSEESKNVSAAVKLEEIGEEEDTDLPEGTETKKFRSSAADAELHELG